jgi:hypothetical protein
LTQKKPSLASEGYKHIIVFLFLILQPINLIGQAMKVYMQVSFGCADVDMVKKLAYCSDVYPLGKQGTGEGMAERMKG